MSLEMSLIELQNPLYVFPIIGVILCALLVYAFGFKTTKPPNFDYIDHNEKKLIITKKKKLKDSVKVSNGKTQVNGHVNTGTAKASDKKTEEKKQKKVPATETSSPSVSNEKNAIKVNAKKDKIKNRKNEQNVDTQDVEDKDSGEWVQLVSKKERKNRKQKEEQLSNKLQETSLATNVKSTKTSPKKQQKKGKENKDKIEKSVSLDSNANTDKTKTNSKTADNKQKEIEVNVENDKTYAKPENVNEEDLIAEDPDIYELVKEQRRVRDAKKAQKHRNKRNSEPEVVQKLEPIVENETNVNQTDKLTASIVANYEATDQNKPDSLSTANNKKKKDKNKKKQPQTLANNATNDKQVLNKSNKIASIPVIETPVEKSDNSMNILITNDVKPSEEDDFKVSVSKKRRARRE